MCWRGELYIYTVPSQNIDPYFYFDPPKSPVIFPFPAGFRNIFYVDPPFLGQYFATVRYIIVYIYIYIIPLYNNAFNSWLTGMNMSSCAVLFQFTVSDGYCMLRWTTDWGQKGAYLVYWLLLGGRHELLRQSLLDTTL
eukprot:jgi/Botrbrau1/102/Bobra.0022s0091.1